MANVALSSCLSVAASSAFFRLLDLLCPPHPPPPCRISARRVCVCARVEREQMTDTWQNEYGNIKVNDRGMRVAHRDGQEELLLEGQVCVRGGERRVGRGGGGAVPLPLRSFGHTTRLVVAWSWQKARWKI